jgi:hypothetical protein
MVRIDSVGCQYVCGFEDTIILGAERSASFFVSFFIMICYTVNMKSNYQILLRNFEISYKLEGNLLCMAEKIRIFVKEQLSKKQLSKRTIA